MEFTHFVEWAFYGIVGGGIVYGVAILSGLKTSIDALNANMSALVEKSEWLEKTLDRHEEKISHLEARIIAK